MSSHLSYRPIRDCPAFDHYVEELGVWVDGSDDDVSVLDDAASGLARHARANGIAAEHLVAALQGVELRTSVALTMEPAARRRRDARHATALRALMQTCYGFEPGLRLVRGPDGRAWVVMHIQEGMRWDPEIEMRRQDWLCCATLGDRRYITPVPPAWTQWSDAELLGAVVRARPDLRGPD
ncbi:MAG TPA: hypothetical protein VF034_00375 [Gemmatimonadaceae bacterium]